MQVGQVLHSTYCGKNFLIACRKYNEFRAVIYEDRPVTILPLMIGIFESKELAWDWIVETIRKE